MIRELNHIYLESFQVSVDVAHLDFWVQSIEQLDTNTDQSHGDGRNHREDGSIAGEGQREDVKDNTDEARYLKQQEAIMTSAPVSIKNVSIDVSLSLNHPSEKR